MQVIETCGKEIRTLSEITREILGPQAKRVVDVCILCTQLSVCTAFLKYFSAQIN